MYKFMEHNIYTHTHPAETGMTFSQTPIMGSEADIHMTMNDNENMFITTDIYSISEQMQDINTSEKASNSNFPLIISMVKGAWSRSLWAPIYVIRKKIFHVEGAENRKKGAWWGKNDIILSTLGSGV